METVTPLQNEWLRKLVPDEFSDVDYLFETVLFEGLIFFWEKDRGLETLEFNADPQSWEDSNCDGWSQERVDCFEAMKAAYEWAKARDSTEPQPPPYELVRDKEQYMKLADVYQQDLQKWDAEKDLHVLNIVKYRKYLWS
ncbi:hypothetical protein Xoosp13_105 [Xanthomonas phage Xoo-sp13]|nr:hypothetical protein Xoosp13_105 [Xanthomonas phage Xoo-sp13]